MTGGGLKLQMAEIDVLRTELADAIDGLRGVTAEGAEQLARVADDNWPGASHSSNARVTSEWVGNAMADVTESVRKLRSALP
jgi:hypothetical protein